MYTAVAIPIGQLRVGMYVQLDLQWMQHPFPVGSFRIATQAQLDTLRGLGLETVRYVPARSDEEFRRSPDGASQTAGIEAAPGQAGQSYPMEDGEGALMRQRLQWQQEALGACDQRFVAATRVYQRLGPLADRLPEDARAQAEALVGDCVGELLANGDSVIRLLSEGVGERNALHPVNVMVLSLLLAQSIGTGAEELHTVGLAALLHDVGKLRLPPHEWTRGKHLTTLQMLSYEKHVQYSVDIVRQMGLAAPVVEAIGQHHEMVDGSGFPLGLSGPAIGTAGRIVALVNAYDGLCNPASGAQALTPHEALSSIFAQLNARFDPHLLGTFIRMMGVYPPGSLVQLVNGRYAIVVSVNSSRPLRPKVIEHDPRVPKDQALVLDLEEMPELGIRRSLRPHQLPRDALDYLSPRKRVCYFFERAALPPNTGRAPL